MPASVVYHWDYIRPDDWANVYIHGFSDNWAVVYSAVVYPITSDGPPPWGQIQVYGEEVVSRHVDGTIARRVYIHNVSINPVAVDLSILYDSY
jgi:hypothetical protein